MVEKYQVYRCELCGNMVGILFAGGGSLVCCGKPMEMMVERTADQGLEKHVPAVQKSGEKLSVKVGTTEHPMTDEHYIMWIDTVGSNAEARKYLKPGEAPSREFCDTSDVKKVRAYCNLHGLWKSEEV
jgi:superoxide reductase